MSKLTLSVDERVVRQAKRYAAKRGTSVSHLVERYLALVVRPPRAEQAEPPVLKLLRGAAKGVDPAAYERHLVDKYR
ncbi:MAG: antitoxin [Deltaproteobacteria bacterium]|nr:antitoxin [Deltaproteobacteria bacterium]